MIKFSDDIISNFIFHNYNNSLFGTIFPSVLQKADISPIHKKKSKLDIENYRPVSILPVLSKIYEWWMFDQLYAYFNNILLKHQCGFCQGYSAQHSLLLMIEKFKKSLDNGNFCGMLLTDAQKRLIALSMIYYLQNWLLTALIILRSALFIVTFQEESKEIK